jgi:hypothetical protein
MRNVNQELHHTQALYDAKNRQIETEDHFKQLSEREAGRIVLEINRTRAQFSEMSEYLRYYLCFLNKSMLQTSIYRGNERIEVIRMELKLVWSFM